MEEIRAAAGALKKLSLVELPSRLEPEALDPAFQGAAEAKVNAIIPTAGRLTLGAKKPIKELCIKYRMPAILPRAGVCRSGRIDVIRPRLLRLVPSNCLFCGQNSQRRKAG